MPFLSNSWAPRRSLTHGQSQKWLSGLRASPVRTVLLLGSGGREDTIAWALSKSDSVSRIGVLPGNPAMKRHPKVECVLGSLKDPNQVVQAAQAFNADLIIIGPEQPIVDGCSDALRSAGFLVAAPSKAAGQLEESKIFSKHFMREFEIPTADFAAYEGHSAAQAVSYTHLTLPTICSV